MTDDTRIDDLISLDANDAANMEPRVSFSSILGPPEEMGLTRAEAEELSNFNRSLVILGPAAARS